jgi:flagellar biosynthesis/type III secretory pathway protein FliH
VILETEWGAIDASIDTQLANIHEALAQAAPSSLAKTEA